MLSLGIDIAGAPGKSLTLALVRWGGLGAPSPVAWDVVPLGKLGSGYPAYKWQQIVHAAGQGNLPVVASLSYTIADHVCAGLRQAIGRLGVQGKIDVFAIDSPSGFSRNTSGHGRATEKVGRFFGLGGQCRAYFQMTPSVACGRVRGNQWAWMLFGMATFHAIGSNFAVSPQSWEQFLVAGLGSTPGGVGGNIIEVFPRATVQYLRYVASQQTQKLIDLKKALGLLTNAAPEVALIRSVLQSGARSASDRADALIAAMTTIGSAYPTKFSATALQHHSPSNYASAGSAVPWHQEGVVYVVG